MPVKDVISQGEDIQREDGEARRARREALREMRREERAKEKRKGRSTNWKAVFWA